MMFHYMRMSLFISGDAARVVHHYPQAILAVYISHYVGIRSLPATADLPQCWWTRDELGIDAAVLQSQMKTFGAKLQV